MRQRLAFLAALAGTLALCPAAAAAERPAPVPAVSSDAALIARAVAGNPVARRPLAKLRGPLCLVVAAEDQSFARAVAERIIAAAKAAGIRTRPAGCSPNALVSFSDDARAQMNAVREDGRKLFRRMTEKEIDTALAARDPAYAFQAVELTPRIMEGDGGGDGGSWTRERSVLRMPRDMVTTMVVFDNRAIAGQSVAQLADYAALRLLAPTGEMAADDPAAPRSILSLFAAPGAAPQGLTAFDRAYLRTLYKLPRTAFAEEVLAETARVAAK